MFTPAVAFALDATERSKSDAWITEHNKAHAGKGHTAIGGRYTYLFTPTTLGTVAKVTCACGESIDLTNHEEW